MAGLPQIMAKESALRPTSQTSGHCRYKTSRSPEGSVKGPKARKGKGHKKVTRKHFLTRHCCTFLRTKFFLWGSKTKEFKFLFPRLIRKGTQWEAATEAK